MDSISNVDRLLLILRQRLAERARSDLSAKKMVGSTSPSGRSPLDRIALLSAEGLQESELRRALIEGILADHFGSGMMNDANFQQVVQKVVESLEDDKTTATLVSGVLKDLVDIPH